MLKEELKKVDCSKDNKFWDAGLVIFSPLDGRFYKIAFGDGTNADDLCDGCDDYMYLTIDEYDDEGKLIEDVDGGQLDFNRKNYSGYINDYNLIKDCLEFLECCDVDDCIVVKKYS